MRDVFGIVVGQRIACGGIVKKLAVQFGIIIADSFTHHLLNLQPGINIGDALAYTVIQILNAQAAKTCTGFPHKDRSNQKMGMFGRQQLINRKMMDAFITGGAFHFQLVVAKGEVIFCLWCTMPGIDKDLRMKAFFDNEQFRP